MAKLYQITCYHMPHSDHKIVQNAAGLQTIYSLNHMDGFCNISISKLPGNKSRCYPIKDFISR
jgi:hypothetical protein